jgi:hypothetical protein
MRFSFDMIVDKTSVWMQHKNTKANRAFKLDWLGILFVLNDAVFIALAQYAKPQEYQSFRLDD